MKKIFPQKKEEISLTVILLCLEKVKALKASKPVRILFPTKNTPGWH